MKKNLHIILTATLSALLSTTTPAQVAGNPPYTLDQSVIASGGGTSADAGNLYSIAGTIGQPVAGTTGTNLPYSVQGGFFTSPPLAPTAAAVTISGRVLTPVGRGLRNAYVVLTDASGNTQMAQTSAFGYFRFSDVPAGETYIVSVVSKRFSFTPQVVSVTEEITGLNFIANAEKQTIIQKGL